MAEGYNPIDSETYYQNVQRGIPSTLLENTFSRDGYSFKGWSTSSTGEVQYSDKKSGVTFNADQHLYAVWELDNWTISYKNALTATTESFPDGTGEWKTYNSSSPLPYYPPTPAPRAGYLFAGWVPNTIPYGSTGNQIFTSTWIPNGANDVGLLVVPVIDMSGSMTEQNIAWATMAATAMITQHKVSEDNPTKVNLKLFYGTTSTELNIATPLLNTNFSSESDLKIFNSIRTELLRKGTSGDEKMLQTLYAAINNVMTNDITLDSRQNGITSVVFSLISDEIWTASLSTEVYVKHTTKNQEKVWDANDDETWWNMFGNSSWVKSWQAFSNQERFPDIKSTYDTFGTTGAAWYGTAVHFFITRILSALKAMSYYYGINFQMCYAGDDCFYFNKLEEDTANLSYRKLYDGTGEGNVPFQKELRSVNELIPWTLPANLYVKEYKTNSNGDIILNADGSPQFWEKTGSNHDQYYETGYGDPIDWTANNSWKRGKYSIANKQKYSTCSALNWYTNLNGKVYQRIKYPANYYAGTLSQPMCKVIICSGYSIANSRIMSPSDLYNSNKYNKFHQLSINGIQQYVAYKYLDFNDIDYSYDSWNNYTTTFNNHNKIRLPSQAEITNAPSGKTLTGWQVMKPSGNRSIVKTGSEWWYSPLSSDVYPDVPFTVYVQPIFT